jgi:hypothetical protein
VAHIVVAVIARSGHQCGHVSSQSPELTVIGVAVQQHVRASCVASSTSIGLRTAWSSCSRRYTLVALNALSNPANNHLGTE